MKLLGTKGCPPGFQNHNILECPIPRGGFDDFGWGNGGSYMVVN